MRGRLPGAAGAALAALAFVACSFSVGTSKSLNTDKGEQLIQEQLTNRTGVAIERVECPERKIKEGDQFDCTAFIEDQSLLIRVTQTDDEGTITGEPQQAILDMNKAVAAFEPSIREQTGVAVRVNCGAQRYRVQAVGSTFDCQLTTPSNATQRIVVTVKSVDGDVDYRVG